MSLVSFVGGPYNGITIRMDDLAGLPAAAYSLPDPPKPWGGHYKIDRDMTQAGYLPAGIDAHCIDDIRLDIGG
ncbi:MAG: hypothetical protein M3N95_00335 [Actinomycetota bacterium]|nr:hypothetical protein [Actinomycetota bacterium]